MAAILIRRMMKPARVAGCPPSGSAARRAALCLAAGIMSACGDGPSGPTTGSLALTIAGLPEGVQNVLTVTGPASSGVSLSINATDTLENLAPGLYTVVANVVNADNGIYVASTSTQQVEVRVSVEPASVTVAYQITTGSIALNVTGLPQGALAAVTVSGPSGYYRQVTQSVTLASLPTGSYVVTGGTVTEGSGHVYSAAPLVQTVNVVASEIPRNVTARYALATGALEVIVSGLAPQQSANISVTGPGGYSTNVTTSTTLSGLFGGTYAVMASNVTAGATYSPSPSSQYVEITPSLTPVRAAISYVEVNQPPPPQFNLTIDGMYITQAVQNFAGGVPLLAGKPGLLRVFVKASATNLVVTTVRARLYQGTVLAQTLTLQPNNPSVPTTINEGTLGSTWNGIVPASLVQPGLRVLVDVDPTNTVTETNEGDNSFPANGTPFDTPVQVTAPLNLTLVPVLQTSTGLTGNATLSTLDDFLVFARKVLPIRDYRVLIHETFTTSAPPVESNNGNNAWWQILSEINALRVAEGTNDYYMGIVGTTYNSGVAGFAFAPGRASVAWDKFPSAAPIVAHELAHSLGRLHAPCGGAANPDASYPYLFGVIGVFGYDIETGQLKFPGTSDLMGYCGFGWISDYTYTGILNYRASTPNSAMSPAVASGRAVASETFVQSTTARKSLVVWGRIDRGMLTLEPAFSAHTKPVLPARAGPYRIEGRTANGRVVFSYAFEGEQPADVADSSARQFAFAIPLDDSLAQSLANISLSAQSGARSVRTVSAAPAGQPSTLDATVDSRGNVQFRLTDPAVPLAVVRDRLSQRIVAFLRPQGQPVTVRSRGVDYDVQLSDGVRSSVRRVRAVRR